MGRAAAALALCIVFAPATASAMEIAAYDKMSSAEKGRYVQYLLNATVDHLRAEGNHTSAQAIVDYINKDKNAAVKTLLDYMDLARSTQIQTGKTAHVEHAMIVFLGEEAKVKVSRSAMMSFEKGFKRESK